jgi:hypothetical protein
VQLGPRAHRRVDNPHISAASVRAGSRACGLRPRFDNRSWVDHPFVGGKGCLTFHPWWPAGLSSRVHAVVTQCGEPGALADRPLAKECFVFFEDCVVCSLGRETSTRVAGWSSYCVLLLV